MLVNLGFIKIPWGYTIEYFEEDEHYHWVNGVRESIAFSNRFDAVKSAWADFRDRFKV